MIERGSKPGRGPRNMGSWYRVYPFDDEPYAARFIGVTFGTNKGADTLHFRTHGEKVRSIRYEDLAGAIAIGDVCVYVPCVKVLDHPGDCRPLQPATDTLEELLAITLESRMERQKAQRTAKKVSS